jgi:bacillopeptidase F
VAIDAAGNRGEARVTIKSDRTLPVVSITSPEANAIVKGPSVPVAGSVADASPFTVEVNETLAMVNGANFSGNVTAADGPFQITARARDAANNVGVGNVNVTVDSTAPVVTITSPADGSAFNTSTVHITGTIADLTAVTLKVGETNIPVSGAAFEYDATLTAEGPATIVFTAADAAGNSSSKELRVIHDTTAPSLTIATPEEAAVVANLRVVLRGMAFRRP